MEQYQFSLTWWIFRILSFVEIVAIVYLFATTWKLSRCLQNMKEMVSSILQTRQGREDHDGVMDAVNKEFTDLHEQHKRKPEYD